MNTAKTTADQLFELETALHKKEVRTSPEAAAALLAEEFKEFGSSGRIFDKTAVLEELKNETVDWQVVVEDFQARDLAPGVVLVTYIASKANWQGPPIRTLRSSIWQLIGNRWQMVFHQGTRMPL